jgi:CxxC motif-containing protein (DUF1111 family)
LLQAQSPADPGIRVGGAAAGGPVAGLTSSQGAYFLAGKAAFNEIQSVNGAGGSETGLGPRFNHNSCGGCHVFPAAGGSSPASNPQLTVAPAAQVNALVGLNIISANGPIREVRFKSDGGVHDLFTITGMAGAPAGCSISQPAFASHVSSNDVVFRIPTPTFGNGLIEAITDTTILARERAPKPFGISGRANRNGNDGTVTRFGWKAQNKSLVIFAGEAYNVEQGITNEIFPDTRGEGGVQDPVACEYTGADQDTTHFDAGSSTETPSDAVAFANFMRFLAAPAPASGGYTGSNGNVTVTAASIGRGSSLFSLVGCATCHTPSMTTGSHSVAALSNQPVNLFSDLLVHNMGRLGDGVSQGLATGNEFRTAPLWGLGQRIFLLHDGRTKDLAAAIAAHAQGGSDVSSEAVIVVNAYNILPTAQKQDLLNFLRSL